MQIILQIANIMFVSIRQYYVILLHILSNFHFRYSNYNRTYALCTIYREIDYAMISLNSHYLLIVDEHKIIHKANI